MRRLALLVLCIWATANLIPSWAGAGGGLIVEDAPDDDGTRLLLRWEVREEWPEALMGTIYRRPVGADGAPGEEEPVSVVEMAAGEFVDAGLEPDRAYTYRMEARSREGLRVELSGGPATPAAQWFNFGRLNILLSLIVFAAALLYFIRRASSGEELYIRKIAGLEAVEDAVGRATEMGRSVFHIPGIGTLSDVATLASLSIMRRVAKKAAEHATPFKVPCTEPLVMTTAQEVVKMAYSEAGRPDLFRPEYVTYLTYDQFGYAAGVDGMMLRERPGAVLLLGYFMAESLILAETGNAIGAIQIAGTDQPSQLPFFVAACDYTLIGEELYAASCYLGREPILLGSVLGQDVLKLIIIGVIGIGVLLATVAAVADPGGAGTLSSLAAWFKSLFNTTGA